MLLTMMLFLGLAPTSSPDQWSKSYTVDGPPTLRVETGDGNVHVRPSEGGTIEARVTTENWKIGGDGIQIVDRQNGNEVEISIKFPRRWFSLEFHRRRVDVELIVPRHLTLKLRTGDGNVDARGISGDLQLWTGDGKIELEDLDGKIRAETGDGGVYMSRAKGDVYLHSGDGKIEVIDHDGALKVETGDGPVRVSGRFDSLAVKTGDGRVEAVAQSGSRLLSDWTVRTGDGGLTMKVAEDLAADVDLHTGDGKIELGIPVNVIGKTDNKSLKGKLNSGGKLLTLQSGDGSIRLLKL
ncbi:MAG TPA: DUF4097 family beta strand repeat-containing protein [Blastocatellia bacterium]|nr:DUF4097 family beta strand repeat-containing protein [Blastocatellia bacterium]